MIIDKDFKEDCQHEWYQIRDFEYERIDSYENPELDKETLICKFCGELYEEF